MAMPRIVRLQAAVARLESACDGRQSPSAAQDQHACSHSVNWLRQEGKAIDVSNPRDSFARAVCAALQGLPPI